MMDFILSLFGGGGIWGYVAMAGAAVASVLGLYVKGRTDGAGAVKRKIDKEYIETRKEMDNAEDFGNDPDAARAWLRARNDNRGL